ncbi:DgyrCDS8766 [Dimorphilus gyrociliatus]|uniref:DgyrCDS8766 n=1 Tax=Dimorphilus gyrociliatus TaxID=2664684 RepID=A0A7I8VV82_9ANNE|nr:DgyrCDS8766 [Dimorphilus gyrociliatus]
MQSFLFMTDYYDSADFGTPTSALTETKGIRVEQSHLRIDKMSSKVFGHHNIQTLKEALDKFFEILLCSIVPPEKHDIMSSKELLERLSALDEKEWGSVRDIFLLDSFHGYSDGNFKPEELIDPSKLLLDLVSALNHMNSEMCLILKENEKRENDLKNKIKGLHERLYTLESELLNAKRSGSQLNTDRVAYLEANLEERTKTIERLQRESNVSLWGKEKERLLADTKKKQEDMENTIKEKSSRIEALTKKIQNLENNQKMQLLKQELQIKSTDESGKKLDEMEKNVFMVRKDINVLQADIFNLNKYIIGICAGLRSDISHTVDLVEKWDKEEVTKHIYNLMSRVEKIRLAAKQGKLGALRADLPDTYIAIDRDVDVVPGRKLSVIGRPIDIQSLRRPKTPDDARKKLLITETDEKSKNEADPAKPIIDHPSVLRDDGSVDYTKCMKLFPFIKQADIDEHFQNFRQYDINGDGSLDLSELTTAMKTTVSKDFTARDLADVMFEVDVDNSQTIDFYEYLLIVNMIINRQGKSAIFRSEKLRREDKHVSKLCVIQ